MDSVQLTIARQGSIHSGQGPGVAVAVGGRYLRPAPFLGVVSPWMEMLPLAWANPGLIALTTSAWRSSIRRAASGDMMGEYMVATRLSCCGSRPM